jgi:hypothetical protein
LGANFKLRPKLIHTIDSRPGKADKWQNNFWLLDLNYLHVAKAALDCSDYFSAILFADVWCLKTLE